MNKITIIVLSKYCRNYPHPLSINYVIEIWNFTPSSFRRRYNYDFFAKYRFCKKILTAFIFDICYETFSLFLRRKVVLIITVCFSFIGNETFYKLVKCQKDKFSLIYSHFWKEKYKHRKLIDLTYIFRHLFLSTINFQNIFVLSFCSFSIFIV